MNVLELLRQRVPRCCVPLRARTCRARARGVSAYGSGRWRERAPLAPFSPLSARAARVARGHAAASRKTGRLSVQNIYQAELMWFVSVLVRFLILLWKCNDKIELILLIRNILLYDKINEIKIFCIHFYIFYFKVVVTFFLNNLNKIK